MTNEFDLTDFGLCSYSVAGGERSAGLAIDGQVIALKALAAEDEELSLALGGGRVVDLLQHWDRAWPRLQAAAVRFRNSEALASLSVPVTAVRLHEPVEAPGTVFCAGANYRQHVVELIMERFKPPGHETMTEAEIRAYAETRMDERYATGEPFHFTKNLTSLCGPYDDIPVPALAKETDWELELGVVIGRRAWCIEAEDALDYVAGYAIAHDVSTRDRMFRPFVVGADFLQAKGLANFFPLGPYLVPKAFVADPQDLRILLKLNGEPMQDETTADMLFSCKQLIAYLSKWVELRPGDVIATGSPSGNGTHYNRYLAPSDRIEGSITGLGVQSNRLVAERRP